MGSLEILLAAAWVAQVTAGLIWTLARTEQEAEGAGALLLGSVALWMLAWGLWIAG